MTKEQILKLVESKIDTCQQLAIESIELIYNAGYNEGVEDCVKEIEASNGPSWLAVNIRRLNK